MFNGIKYRLQFLNMYIFHKIVNNQIITNSEMQATVEEQQEIISNRNVGIII